MPAPFVPKDSTRREHIGRVEKVVYGDPSRPFVILALTDGSSVLGPAVADQFDRHSLFRFLGRWRDDAKRGPQFHFSTHVMHQPAGRAGVVKYLTDHCDGIGLKTAAKLYDALGSDAVRTLRESPDLVAERTGLDPALCRAAAGQLAEGGKYEATRVELFDLFAGRGFQGKLIEDAIDTWGARAATVIRRNPFALLGRVSAGFKRCDKLWSDLGLPKDSLKRQALCAWNALRNETDGHTWVAAESLAATLRDLVPTADPAAAFKLALRARRLKKHRDGGGKLWLAAYDRGTAEERVAAQVARLAARPTRWPAVEPGSGGKPSEHQVERLRLATAGPVGLLLGGPGTGKTTSVAAALHQVIARYGRGSVVLTAPTGKAAVRMTQAVRLAGLDLRAKTIHSTLGIGRNGHDGDGWGFGHGPGRPLDGTFFVVDECSMIDTGLMADLLEAIPTGGQVLLVGDPYQLPPVGHGAPLRDLIAAGVPHGELTQVRRNAGQIVHACVRVKNGESFETADVVDLDAEVPKNLKLVEARDEAAAAEAVVNLVKRLTKFDPVWQTQVIVARNTAGDLSRVKLNERLHPLLNPDGYTADGNPFKVGDKIICLRNSRPHRVEPLGAYLDEHREEMVRDAGCYQVVRDPETNEPEPVYVANGEIGRVVAVAKRLTIARFSEGEALVKIPMGRQKDPADEEGGEEEKGRGCNFDHAYAVTCHKCQGSESPCVIVVADPGGGRIADRAWWYTAISRASKLCILVGSMGVIDQQRLRQSLSRRKTFLAERVKDVIQDSPRRWRNAEG